MSSGLLTILISSAPRRSSLWCRVMAFRFRVRCDAGMPRQGTGTAGVDGAKKFLKRNRKAKRHGGHAVKIYRCEKELGLPFLQAGFPDVGRNADDLLPAIDDEKFIDIDIDNFDERIKAMKPRNNAPEANVAGVNLPLSPNAGADNLDRLLAVDMANKVDILRKLLDTRLQPGQLQRYADGGQGAQALLLQLSNDKALLNFLVQMGQWYDEDESAAAPLHPDDISGR
ncbi:type VI secretion system contractile sheath small subunit [Herbaspirillum autotrophicum]|uniref:type VI secretion system contractile sheath small subunit n=1 Tax=Herbaspirillum autotrophicum TaxID=180195 RepID=UPI0009FADB4D